MSSVIELVVQFKPLYKIATSTPIFKLNTVFTPFILWVIWTCLTIKEFFLCPIECLFCENCDDTLQKFLNTWCWISSTYTVPDSFKIRKMPMSHPGIGTQFPDTKLKQYNYYQYVLYALVSQGLLFMWIGALWKYWENNFMAGLTKDCERYAISKDDIKEQVERFTDYFSKHMNYHNHYVLKYWFTELLCFLNILLQMILMDWFFSGDFSRFGIGVLNLLEEQDQERIDHIMLIFPKMTKCTFHKFGPGGGVELKDTLCVLGQNNYNEKVYIFLWFWYWILLILSGAVLLFRIALISSRKIRINVLGSRDFSIPEPIVRTVAERGSIGDWWVVYMLALNVDNRVFKEFMQSLSDKITSVVPVKEGDHNVETWYETY